MITFHHVNLAVQEDGLDDEVVFVTEVLGCRRVAPDPSLEGLGVNWFEADDGSQIHLGVDPDHRPAARAHVAMAFGTGLEDVERRLEERGIGYDSGQRPGFPRVLICLDPAGNRWELRGDQGTASR